MQRRRREALDGPPAPFHFRARDLNPTPGERLLVARFA